MESIRQVLSMVLEQHAIELELQQRQYGILVSPLHDHKLLTTASFVLAASANCDSEELRQRLPAHLKVGPVERIRQLVNLHLPGLKVKPLPVAPRQIRSTPTKPISSSNSTPKIARRWTVPAASRSTSPVSSPSSN
jgi:type VI secretion system protein ImpJ